MCIAFKCCLDFLGSCRLDANFNIPCYGDTIVRLYYLVERHSLSNKGNNEAVS